MEKKKADEEQYLISPKGTQEVCFELENTWIIEFRGYVKIGFNFPPLEAQGVLGKIKSLYRFASSELRRLPLGKKLGVKITRGDWYPPIWCRTKKRYQLSGNVLGLQWDPLKMNFMKIDSFGWRWRSNKGVLNKKLCFRTTRPTAMKFGKHASFVEWKSAKNGSYGN
ncbi:hypothetical protein TNCV_1438611 [Trichonephila clavipes]|nr:hypothetical protein TNCV_1438611 [Trichonephila clavipes]